MLTPEDERPTIWTSGVVPPKYTPPTRMDLPQKVRLQNILVLMPSASLAETLGSTGAVTSNPELAYRSSKPTK
eukprot:5398499-Amphidinium_carterae.4